MMKDRQFMAFFIPTKRLRNLPPKLVYAVLQVAKLTN